MRALVGYMPEGDAVLPELTAVQYTTLSAELCGLPRAEATARSHQVLHYVGLGEARYRKLGIFGGNNAYIEGWALYSERLADENGWYEGDLPGRLGYLKLQLFRARRLVADTGLHAKHWTRDQAIAYGFTQTEAERYVVWPGQACSYMIGQLRILELREKAKAALGQKYDLKAFDDALVLGGNVPLDVLAKNVDEYIRTAKG